jgi:predicted metalloprotease
MEWENTPISSNVEDRRGQGGGGGLSLGGGGLGIGGVLLILAISYFTGINPSILLGGAEVATHSTPQREQQVTTAPASTADSRSVDLVKHVLGETEAVWAKVLPDQKGVNYVNPRLVLYSGSTDSGCGGAQAAMGPFYCPNDQKIYLDLSFFRDMQTKYGGGGDFAYAYVIAHEVGHHVQDLLGILGQADKAKRRASQTQANAISVRIELMADCLAGVWAANANKQWKLIDDGDIQRALATAQAIGDDRLQTAARGYSVPDSFTHGSSAMRQKWLTTGLHSGQVDSCNTFAQ